MENNKKPSEPMEPERWAKMEDEPQKLKRSNLLLSIGYLPLVVLYGLMILELIQRISRIDDTLALIVQFDGLVSDHLQSLGDSLIKVLDNFEMLLNALLEAF